MFDFFLIELQIKRHFFTTHTASECKWIQWIDEIFVILTQLKTNLGL